MLSHRASAGASYCKSYGMPHSDCVEPGESLALRGILLLWACLAVAISGFAIGLRFRVTVIVPAALVLAGVTIAASISSGWSLSRTVAVLLLLLAIQQCSYLVGLFASLRR
jgi:hypothetical protein